MLTITLNGAEFPMPERYVYTTRANSASPLIGIDIPRIQQQVKRVRELIPRGVAFPAVLKNGEPVGLLADAMARAAQVDYFCVPNMQDGIALREAGVKAPIMVLYLTEPSYAPVLLHYGLEPAAYSLAWVDEVVAAIHAGASDVLHDGTTPVYYDMLRIGTLLFENASPEHRNYTWRTRILQVKTLPKGWCVDYDCEATVKTDTPVGLVAHIPYDDVIYRVRGQRMKALLDHGDVIALDLSHLPDVRAGEGVDIILPDPNSPLDSPHSVPVTLLNGADS